MAKVRIDTSRITKKIEDTFKDLMTKDTIYVEIANFSKERIQSFARLQKRMEQDGADKASTPNLSPGYIERRRKLTAGQGGTDSKFFIPTVKNSQLTFTGQLLKSLNAKILRKNIDKGQIELKFTGKRDDGQLNANVYNELLKRDSGYNILALSKKAIERIRTIVLNQLRKELQRRKLK
jgi:hypothetical protein